MSAGTVKTAVVAALVLLVCIATFCGDVRADYYKYTDGSGAVCITNRIDAVPPKYRATMKVIREETAAGREKGAPRETPREYVAAPDASPQSRQQADAAEEPASRMGEVFSRFPWARPLLVVCVIVTAFLIVNKLSSLISSPLLARVVYLAFFLAIFVFAYKSYAEHVTNSYFSIKTRVLAMFEKANRREVPASAESPPPAPAMEPGSR